MATLADKTSLLVFRVGPVLCCAPSLPVESIIVPPQLTHPPGSNQARPGIFKHGGHIVTGLDLRYKFGVDKTDWITPGRMIVTSLSKGHVGFWVDEILQVIEEPKSGWGPLPPLLPRGIFSRTLLLENDIYLYAEFEAMHNIPDSGYLRGYIQHLLEQQKKQITSQVSSATARFEKEKPNATTTVSEKTATPVTATPVSSRVLKSSPRIDATNTHAKPAPNSTQRETIPVAKPHPATLTSPPVRPESIKTTVNTAPVVKRPITAPARQDSTTVNKQPPRRASQTPRTNTGGWLLLVLFLLLLTGSGWLLNTPDENYEQIAQPVPTPQHDTAEVPSESAVDIKAATVIETPPNTDSMEELVTTTTDPVTEEVIETVTTTNETTLATVTPTYSASIEQDQEGFTIVIDAPEDSDIFKPDSSKNNSVTDAATETPQAKPEITLDETVHTDPPVPVTEKAPVKPLPKTEVIHIVVKGDTLWHIAIRYLNNPYLYPELAKLSNIKNPDLIYPGNRVRIIKRSKKSDS